MKLFSQLRSGSPFHYGDKPDHLCIKVDKRTQICTHGFRQVDPNVLVFEEKEESHGRVDKTQNPDRLRL